MPNGRVIEMSTEQYFDMTDEDFEYLMANNYGDEVEDPFFGSILTSTKKYADIPLDIVEDLTQITDAEKLVNPDIDFEVEE
jgi:hypothetical protein